jgi:hypothetical protein
MPTAHQLEEIIAEFAEIFEACMLRIERKYKKAGKSLDGLATPLLVGKAKKVGPWLYRDISLFFSHLEELYLKIDFYDSLVLDNKEANAVAGKIFAQLEKLGSDIAASAAVHTGLEAHHFIPQTLLKDFPVLRLVFRDEKIMPAVNLTRLEHRGSLAMLARFASEGPLPGVLGDIPNGQRIESVTTGLNKLVSDLRKAAPPNPTKLQERAITKQLLQEIEKLYDNRYPRLLDHGVDLNGTGPGWTTRTWLRKAMEFVDRVDF